MDEYKSIIKEISKKLAISEDMVIHALNNVDETSIGIQEKVLKIIKEFEDAPHVLSGDKGKDLALIIPYIDYSLGDIYYGRILSGVSIVAKKNGYNIVLESADSEFIDKEIYLKLVREQDIKGFLIAGVETGHKKYIEGLIENNIPFIFINSILPGLDANYVMTDNVDIGYSATKYLIQKGHRKIIHILGDTRHTSAVDRFEGYKKALNEYRIEFNQDFIIDGIYLQDPAYNNFKLWFKKKMDFTAVFCANDSSAMGIYKALSELKCKIPEDYSIIGVDDNPLYHKIYPKLTTIRQPIHDLAKLACEKFILLLDNKISKINVIYPFELMEKETVKKIRSE